MITFRPTRLEDIPRIMALVREAQHLFRLAGIDQWQDGYPTEENFMVDLQAQRSYVGERSGEILLSACLSFDGEPTYNKIYDGEWLNEEPYAVVHRLVVSGAHRRHGLAKAFMQAAFGWCREANVGQMRIDTHRDNLPMQALLKQLGFHHCGRIVLESGADREAYHLDLRL